RDIGSRVDILERDALLVAGAGGLRDSFDASEAHLHEVVDKAQELLPLVEIPEQIRWFIALVCIDAGASGHRADIVVSNAARTLCAWREAERILRAADSGGEPAHALSVTTEDVVAAAELALAHRRRTRHDGPPTPSASSQSNQERYQEMAKEAETA